MWTKTYFRRSSLGWQRWTEFLRWDPRPREQDLPPRSSLWSGGYVVLQIQVISSSYHPSRSILPPPITECWRTSHVTSHSKWNEILAKISAVFNCSPNTWGKKKKKKTLDIMNSQVSPPPITSVICHHPSQTKNTFLSSIPFPDHCPGRCLRFTNLFTKGIQVHFTSFSLPFWPVSSYLNQTSPQPGNPPSSVLKKETGPWPNSISKSFHKIIPSREA